MEVIERDEVVDSEMRTAGLTTFIGAPVANAGELPPLMGIYRARIGFAHRFGGIMDFRHISEPEWRVMQHAGDTISTIRAKACLLVDSLALTFNHQDLGGAHGLLFSRSDIRPAIALVESELGGARFVLDWNIDNAKLVGNLILQRELLDEMDRTRWQPVWGILISSESDTAEEGVTSPIGRIHASDSPNVAENFAVGMTILLAIARGPLVN